MIERVADGEEADEAARRQAARRQGGDQSHVRQEDHRARLRLRRHAVAAADAGLRLPAPDRRRPRGVLGGDATRIARREQAPTRSSPTCTCSTRRPRPSGVRIDRADLVAQGKHVELFAGVEDWFDAIGAYVKSTPQSHGVALRHYLVSSGLTEIIEGTSHLQALPQRVRLGILVRRLRPAVPQARHHRHRQDAVPVPHQQGRRGPRPEHQPAHARGGAADPVRQHDLLRRRRHRRAVDGGDAQERRPRRCRASARQAAQAKCVDLFKAGRCDFFAPADYRRGSDLFKRTCLLLDRILADIRVQEEMWRLGREVK